MMQRILLAVDTSEHAKKAASVETKSFPGAGHGTDVLDHAPEARALVVTFVRTQLRGGAPQVPPQK